VKKTILIIGVILTIASCAGKKIIEPEGILFSANYTEEYCGGAPPSDELIESLMTPKPYSDSIYLHQSAKRDDEGVKFAFNKNGQKDIIGLVNGEYFVFLNAKRSREYYQNTVDNNLIDPNCMYDFNQMIIEKIVVSDTTTVIGFNIHKMCNPCEPPKP
jgi:hypothetical protein